MGCFTSINAKLKLEQLTGELKPKFGRKQRNQLLGQQLMQNWSNMRNTNVVYINIQQCFVIASSVQNS